MARKPRIYIPDMPCLIYLCGNNQQHCFYCDADYQYFLRLLAKAANKYNIALHAYVLMDKHIQLLLTPSSKHGISRLMQYLCSSYVRYINKRYQRSGSLFQGRHKASVVDANNYLLACMRHIEFEPVRAGVVSHPCEYPYSSNKQNGQHQTSATYPIELCKPMQYLTLGDNLISRKSNYQKLFSNAGNNAASQLISERLQHNYPIGNKLFIAELENNHHLILKHMKPGRPAKPLQVTLPIIFC
ncbi:transposase [Thalassotalea sp. ND16A]|uniref:transposase n=1 Tax=Thalassotalea sp. ND16A TaxID=1535422 RepID=UPI00051A64B1|nr:transposase [Thalassotalea sp. ND16A]KGJ92488.1 hypothetical protein ND16A_1666 [Thalassotalea sp. ND16A]